MLQSLKEHCPVDDQRKGKRKQGKPTREPNPTNIKDDKIKIKISPRIFVMKHEKFSSKRISYQHCHEHSYDMALAHETRGQYETMVRIRMPTTGTCGVAEDSNEVFNKVFSII